MFCPNCGKQIKDSADFCGYCGTSLKNWKGDSQTKIGSFTQAVAMAKAGNNDGYTYLYEQTYKSKYYLALKYMGTKESAEDILQDAYIKAFSKLDTLSDPESFPSWFGTIVANTAKDALQKKNPVLFTDMSSGGEDIDEQELQIPDEDLSTQPEVAYTKQETSKMVQEMIGALSEEQKMCILMYYIDGESIKDIASALDCSENTVKSRLNYGRKNLRAEAEKMGKKGYKLYGLAPLPLLLLLLHSEAGVVEASGAVSAEMAAMEGTVLATTGARAAAGSAAATVSAGVSAGVGSATSATAQSAAGAAAGQGFIHTTAGQIATGAFVAIVGAGAVIGGTALYNNSNQEEPEPIVEEVEEETIEPETPVVIIEEPELEPITDSGDFEVSTVTYISDYMTQEAITEGLLDLAERETEPGISASVTLTNNSAENYAVTVTYEYKLSLSYVNGPKDSFYEDTYTYYLAPYETRKISAYMKKSDKGIDGYSYTGNWELTYEPTDVGTLPIAAVSVVNLESQENGEVYAIFSVPNTTYDTWTGCTVDFDVFYEGMYAGSFSAKDEMTVAPGGNAEFSEDLNDLSLYGYVGANVNPNILKDKIEIIITNIEYSFDSDE